MSRQESLSGEGLGGSPRRAKEKGKAEMAGKKKTLSEAFEKSTKPLGDGRKPELPRREITFVMDASVCAPGVFDEDFEVTLRALTSAEELAAARGSKGDVTVMALDMAKRSIHAIDGEVVDRSRGQDEWLWGVIGSGGRQLITAMFANIGTPGEAALGKAMASIKVS